MTKKHHKHKEQGPNLWMWSSIALAILLVVSISTQGFSFRRTVDDVLTDLNTLHSKESSPQVKSALNKAISSLEEAKTTVTNAAMPDVEAKVVIEEFSDFECPFCGRAVDTVQQVKDTYGNDVEIVYKHFPLSIHPDAQKAAEASECARDQGRFWEYHDLLFMNQRALDVNNLKKYATDLGLDMSRFNGCLDSGEKASLVQEDFDEGRNRGVSGTPTFFINGQKLVGAQPFSSFKPIIEAQLSGEAPAAPEPAPPSNPGAVVSMDDDPVKGMDSARIAIVEFSDFECPFCARFYSQTLPQIEENYVETGKVKLVYRDFPLSFHSQAAPAAEAAECADDQGKFWEMHDRLFENQQSLSSANYKKWAEDLGLDMEKFNECVESRKYQDEHAKDMSDGQAAGVTGTPGFIVGVIQDDGTVVGQAVKGAQPYSVFQSVIEQELGKA